MHLISKLVRKVSNQLQVLKRHKRLIPTGAKKRLYEAFILSHLNYCCIIWNHCGKKKADKQEKINERCLRFGFNGFRSAYDELLNYIYQPCLQDRIIHICWLLFIEHLMVTPLYILRIYSLKEILLTTYVANIFSMSPGLTLQTMGYTLSVIQLVNFGTRYQTHSEPLLRPMLLN